MGGLCQGRPAVCRAFIHMVEKIPRQGRLEGCPNVCCNKPDLRIGRRVMKISSGTAQFMPK